MVQTSIEPRFIQGYRNVVTRAISSGYMAMFQLPLLPELTWRLGFTKIWPSIVGYIENTDAHRPLINYAIQSVSGLYRENLVQPLLNPSQRKTTIPVHMLVMTKDPFVPSFMSQDMEEWVTDVQYSEVAAGHWGIVSHPQQIMNTIKNYIFDKSLMIMIGGNNESFKNDRFGNHASICTRLPSSLELQR